jgi:spore coat-associated protein N
MSIKKKLGLGVASAALGLSLIGGGTWAAFNDTATINNHFAMGTLDLTVGKVNAAANFDLGNMKPNDSVLRVFTLHNNGSLAIKEVLLNTIADSFKDGNAGALDGNNAAMLDYLSQFEINVFNVDSENTHVNPNDPNNGYLFEPRMSIVKPNQTLTLKDLVDGGYKTKVDEKFLAAAHDLSSSTADNRINLAPLVISQDAQGPGDAKYIGLPAVPRDTDPVYIKITFKSTSDKNNDGTYVQNKYQGDSANFYFNLEATQWDGTSLDSSNPNGEYNNGVTKSSDGDNSPSPKVLDQGQVFKGNEVIDNNNKQ